MALDFPRPQLFAEGGDATLLEYEEANPCAEVFIFCRLYGWLVFSLVEYHVADLLSVPTLSAWLPAPPMVSPSNEVH